METFLFILGVTTVALGVFLAGFVFGATMIRKIDKDTYTSLHKDLGDWTQILREDNAKNFMFLADEFKNNIMTNLSKAQAELQERRMFQVGEENDDSDDEGSGQLH
jgi:hypothetical protein